MDRSIAQGVLKIQAPIIVIDSQTVLRHGSIIVHGGVVVEVDAAEARKGIAADKTIRLPGHILHPGFVNAHAHLELSYMKGLLNTRAPFVDWIRELMAFRAITAIGVVKSHAVMGARRMARTGTTCVGDVSQTGLAAPALARLGLRGVIFHEVIGFDPALAQERLEGLAARMDEGERLGGLLRQGVAPHAVYSTSARLIQMAAQLAHERGAPLSIHLAETEEENEFSLKGTGPFSDLLEEMGMYDKRWIPKARPTVALKKSGALAGALVVHGNHLSAADIVDLKKAGAKVAYCPGSNRWFGRSGDHPLPRLIGEGVPAGLGTDSMASNTDLDMRSEMLILMRTFKEIGPAGAFGMATEGGAMALGLPANGGTLRPGAPFDAAAIKMAIGPKTDPFRKIIESKSDYSRLWVAGRPVRL